MKNPKVSILLAVHNGMPYLPQAIDSVLAQTYKDWELLIGVNGLQQDDDTLAVVGDYAKKDTRRIKMVQFTEQGKSITLNGLLQRARGQFLAIQDADDAWMPDKLMRQVKHLNDCEDYGLPYQVGGTWYMIIDHKGAELRIVDHPIGDRDIVDAMIKGDNKIGNLTAIMRKDEVLKAGGWDPKWEGIEDYDLWLRLIKNRCRFLNIPEVLAKHRLHDKSHFNTQTFDLNKLLTYHGYGEKK